jgi:hypothetical protein
MLPNNQWTKEKIKTGKTLEQMKMQAQPMKTYRRKQKQL